MKYLIAGAVAAGASAAARLRRLDESAEIILFERGRYVSFANCGLPYHVGKVIPHRDALLVVSPEKFKSWFRIDVRTESEVIAIDRDRHEITIKTKDKIYTEPYDKLLLATGSSPIPFTIPGGDDPRIHSLWTLPDMDTIIEQAQKAKSAIVIGGGFIGLETAENLHVLGLKVTIVQHSDHLMPPMDREMANLIHQELARDGVRILLQCETVGFESHPDKITVLLKNGQKLDTDLVIAGIGVRPNSDLAKSAGLTLGKKGHIHVDPMLRTSDLDIFAAGDVIEVDDPILGGTTAIPLAGPANKQGRIAAGNMTGLKIPYRGSYGASVIKIGMLTAACIGMNEARLKAEGINYHKIYTHPASNASYYPGGSPIHIKLLFDNTGKILGAQLAGGHGVDKRLDVIGTAMQAGRKAQDLAELELAYAPPYNSAKDPVNYLGMIAQNVLEGRTRLAYSDSLPDEKVIPLDVREPAEFDLGAIPGAINIPLGQIRDRLTELDPHREYVTVCGVGMRGYLAEQILRAHGFNVRNLSGGITTWKLFQPVENDSEKEFESPLRTKKSESVNSIGSFVKLPPEEENDSPANVLANNPVELDVRALACPGPVVRLKKTIDTLNPGDTIHLLAPFSFASDLKGWANSSGNEILSLNIKPDLLEAFVRKSGGSLDNIEKSKIIKNSAEHSAAIVLFSNDLDKAMAAMIIACGMAASGAKVGIFFTFWGLSVLRKEYAPSRKKSFLAKMFGAMLPRGATKLSLSKMNMGGLGTKMMKKVMIDKNVIPLPDLIRQAKELGVKFIACDMAMDIMGISKEELIDVDEIAGVASFVELAKNSNNTLFI